MKEILSNFTDVLKNRYAQFTGRARRKEFWYFVLVNAIVAIVLNIVDMIIGYPILGGIYSLLVLIPMLALGIRRLHDVGKSGWFYLLAIIPIVNFYLIYLWVIEGEAGENKYGPNPKN